MLLAESWDLSEGRSDSEVWVSPVCELVELDVGNELEEDAEGVEKGLSRRGVEAGRRYSLQGGWC